ncbi:hypothetical protein R3P38DRAFT_3187708 [Favolaschia claudopus]|uniref:Uncharacterized protein n=1 Tax=Favolaschia claudopus TaxID=2862362 RepID=A0AAW0BZC6_9AGAR
MSLDFRATLRSTKYPISDAYSALDTRVKRLRSLHARGSPPYLILAHSSSSVHRFRSQGRRTSSTTTSTDSPAAIHAPSDLNIEALLPLRADLSPETPQSEPRTPVHRRFRPVSETNPLQSNLLLTHTAHKNPPPAPHDTPDNVNVDVNSPHYHPRPATHLLLPPPAARSCHLTFRNVSLHAPHPGSQGYGSEMIVVYLSFFAFANDTSFTFVEKSKVFLSRYHRNFGPILKDNVLIWPVLEGARARRNVYARSPARHRISFIDAAPNYRGHLLRRSTAAASRRR